MMDSCHWLQQLAVVSLLLAPALSLSLQLQHQHTGAQAHHLQPYTSCHYYLLVNRRTALSETHTNLGCKRSVQQTRTLKIINFPFSLFAVSAGDFDAFMDELDIDANDDVEKTENKVPSHFIQRKADVGIGGNSGFIYDVNALKRNLVQESVRGCKKELLILLGDGRQYSDGVLAPRFRRDRDDLIEERLSALVQANPVSTTTDSNILDGEWTFAFATNSASSILDTSRFLLSKTKRMDGGEDTIVVRNNDSVGNTNVVSVRGGPWRFRSGKTENPFRSSTRRIFLENLEGDENAHIIDTTRVLGGLYQISQRYDVYGLTRTALDLDMTESESKIFGFCVKSRSRHDFKGTKQGRPLEIQVLYLDTDLCICTTGAGLDGPLHVYTKSDLWVTGLTKRKLRLIAQTASWIASVQSPLRLRKRLMTFFGKAKERSKKSSTGLKAVNIGELDIDEDGTTKEDAAWDGPDDPFLHLSPGERMEVLRTMSLRDIYQSASEKKEQNKKQRNKWRRRGGNKFKRPNA